MELRPGIEVDDHVLDEFAHRHAIRRIAAFGSVLRGDFGPASDIDLLVEFEPDHVPGLLAIAGMEIELERLLGRAVDVRTYGDLSRHFRDQVCATAQELYAADDDVRLRHLIEAAETAIRFDVLWSTVRDDLPALLALIPSPESGG